MLVCKFRTVRWLVNTALYKNLLMCVPTPTFYILFSPYSEAKQSIRVTQSSRLGVCRCPQQRIVVTIWESAVGFLGSKREVQRLCCLNTYSLLALPYLMPFVWYPFKSKEHHRIKAKGRPWLYSSPTWLIVRTNWSDLKQYWFSRATSWVFSFSEPNKSYC